VKSAVTVTTVSQQACIVLSFVKIVFAAVAAASALVAIGISESFGQSRVAGDESNNPWTRKSSNHLHLSIIHPACITNSCLTRLQHETI
jgi:hypothetical protein